MELGTTQIFMRSSTKTGADNFACSCVCTFVLICRAGGCASVRSRWSLTIVWGADIASKQESGPGQFEFREKLLRAIRHTLAC
jgi:hypothetical protein